MCSTALRPKSREAEISGAWLLRRRRFARKLSQKKSPTASHAPCWAREKAWLLQEAVGLEGSPKQKHLLGGFRLETSLVAPPVSMKENLGGSKIGKGLNPSILWLMKIIDSNILFRYTPPPPPPAPPQACGLFYIYIYISLIASPANEK